MAKPKSILKGDIPYALVFPSGIPAAGPVFLTSKELPFQVGLAGHPAGHTIRPHQHPPQKYHVESMSEFLYVESGKLKATIYDEKWNVLGEETLGAGDAILLLRGGHGFEVVEECRFFEVKQGPFPGDANAKTFLPAA